MFRESHRLPNAWTHHRRCVTGRHHASRTDAWVAAKGSLPIIGPRTLTQLEANLAAANVTLSAEHIARLDEVSTIRPVYPYTVLKERRIQDLVTGGMVDRIDMPAVSAA